MAAQSNHRNTRGADILRGVAILLVVAYHSFGSVWGWYVPWSGWLRDFGAAPSQPLLWFYPITFGWAGVSLFFVISGFCIHYSFLRSGCFNAGEFFWRRFWRIYPAYIVALLAFTLAVPYGIGYHGGLHQFVTHALFLHNGSYTQFFGINGSFWSIAVEVQLYLLYPLLLWLRAKIGLPRSLAVLFAIGCCWRLGAVWLADLPDHLITPAWTCPLMTWFDWTLGALVAERFAAGKRTFRRPTAWLALLLPLFAAGTTIKPLTIFSFTLAAAAAAVALDAALHVTWRTNRTTRFLTFTGTISYSLYLWHQPLITPIVSAATWLSGSTIVAWLVLMPALLAVACLSYTLLERPGINAGRLLWNMLTDDGAASSKTAVAAQRQSTDIAVAIGKSSRNETFDGPDPTTTNLAA